MNTKNGWRLLWRRDGTVLWRMGAIEQECAIVRQNRDGWHASWRVNGTSPWADGIGPGAGCEGATVGDVLRTIATRCPTPRAGA